MSNTEKDFLGEIKKQLDQSVDHIDGATRSRLNQIRNHALASQGSRSRPRHPWLWTWGAAVPALLLALFIAFGLPDRQLGDQQAVQLAAEQARPNTPSFEVAALTQAPADPDDLKILMSGEELEMLSDLDFLTWLASEEEVGG